MEPFKGVQPFKNSETINDGAATIFVSSSSGGMPGDYFSMFPFDSRWPLHDITNLFDLWNIASAESAGDATVEDSAPRGVDVSRRHAELENSAPYQGYSAPSQGFHANRGIPRSGIKSKPPPSSGRSKLSKGFR